jgi:hypothetical protein
MLRCAALAWKCGRPGRSLAYTLGAVGIVSFAVAPRTALAADTTSADSCPTREATLAAVDALLGHSAIRSEDLEQVTVTDSGTSFSITVKGRVREYTDNARDCGQRARIAAVFVALTLAPPDIAGLGEDSTTTKPETSSNESSAAPAQTTPPPTQARSQRPASTPVLAPITEHSYAQVELGAKIALSPIDDPVRTSWGAQSRFILSGPRWGISLGLDVPARSTFDLGTLRVQQSRYSADVTLRYHWDVAHVRTALDVGPLLSLLQLKLADVPSANRVSRWLPGLRVGAAVTWFGYFIAPFVGADVHFLPVRIPIAVEPEGVVGYSSAIWLGVTLGVAIGGY